MLKFTDELGKLTAKAEGKKYEAEEAVNEAAEAVEEKAEEAKSAAQDIAQKAADVVKDIPGKVKEALDKTDVDEKIVEGAKNVIGKIGSLFSGKDKE